ncbi:MAG: hypothetical protein KatS3mg057_0207 [Herpetosiphonaceae bacterium]|nr:MAG: hypothetical protein KatS3mg057_0207 [Herpetosiphonaceae bacterium]
MLRSTRTPLLAVCLALLIASLLLASVLAADTHGLSPNWDTPAVQVSSGAAGVSSTGGVGRKLAVDPQNRLHIVWTEQTLSPQRFDIYYARSTDGGKTWTTGREIVGGSDLPAIGPNIAVDRSGTLHLAWIDLRGGTPYRVYYSRSFDGGDTWEEPRPVSSLSETLDAAVPSISVDTSGRVHLAWHVGNPDQDSTIAQVYYTRSTDGGDTFEEPRRLNTDLSHHAAWPRFSVEGTSGDVVAIAWRDNRRDPDWDVYMAISTDGGQTFVEQAVQATSARDWDPDVLVDAFGVIHLSYTTFPDTEDTEPSVGYRFSTDQGQSWSDPLVLSEARSMLSSWAYDPSGKRLWLWWKDERDADPPPSEEKRSDVVAKYSTDGGLTWSELQFVTDEGDAEVYFPGMALGADGRAYAMWSIEVEPGRNVVYARSEVYQIFLTLITSN